MVHAIASPLVILGRIYRTVHDGISCFADNILETCLLLADISFETLLRNHNWALASSSLAARIQLYAINALYKSRTAGPQTVPKLETSVRNYVKSISPFFADLEFQSIQTRSRYFIAFEGAKLQQQLIPRASISLNWIQEIKIAEHLEHRFSSLLTSYYELDSCLVRKNSYADPKIDRAARIIFLELKFRQLVRSGSYSFSEPFQNMYGTNRCPGAVRDSLQNHRNSRHIIVLARGHIFKMDVEDLSEEEIAGRLASVYQDSMAENEKVSVAALTLQGRFDWSHEREILREDNADTLQTIETALFAVRFSDKTPSNELETAEGVFKDVRDLWIDKCFTWTVFANGVVGLIGERVEVGRYHQDERMRWIFSQETYRPGQIRGTPTLTQKPGCLPWKLPAMVEKSLPQKMMLGQEVVNPLDLLVARYTLFGGKQISKWRCSPDSFVQMALQLAFFEMSATLPLTFTSVLAHFYYPGNQENFRSATKASLQFCNVMHCPGKNNNEKRKALNAAIRVHESQRKATIRGKGCDAHLNALSRVHEGQMLPRFFTQNDYNLPADLSTSYSFNSVTFGDGFYPANPIELAVSYRILADEIHFNISKIKHPYRVTAEQFYLKVTQSLAQMRNLYE